MGKYSILSSVRKGLKEAIGVYPFGSYARGEASEKSDLDFRIDKGKVQGVLI
jgi:predicted nucleotidyltransferase